MTLCLRRILIVLLVLDLAAPLPAGAALVPSDRVAAGLEAGDGRAAVGSFLSRDDVRRQLERFGVDPKHAQERVDAFSDSEVQQLAGAIESAPAGGVVVLLLLLIIVILVLDR